MPDQEQLEAQAENDYYEGLLDAEVGGEELCWTCDGARFVLVGVDVDSDDAINGPFEGETIRCPNCRGSGRARDCWYW